MSQAHQLRQDLQFIRAAVTKRQGRRRPPAGVYWIAAVYVLIGYTLLDFRPVAANWFFLLAGLASIPLYSWAGKRAAAQTGELDRAARRTGMLHFCAGIALAVASAAALAAVIPALRGPAVGQLVVVMIGLVYFLAGVHLDRNFLWLGPLLMVGGVLVGFAPHHGWTCLGIVIALGLVVPTLFQRGQNAPTSPAA